MAKTLLDDKTIINVVKQVEYYLSDKNLLEDRNDHLKNAISNSEDGMVCLASICSYPKMKKYLGLGKADEVSEETVEVVANILRISDFLDISKDGKKVGRKTPIATSEEIDNRTVAVSPLPQNVKRESVEAFFTKYGKVRSVTLPRHVSNKKVFCGTGLLEFSTEEVAQKFLKRNVVYDGAHLELKTKKVFDAEREKEAEEFEKTKRERNLVEFSTEDVEELLKQTQGPRNQEGSEIVKFPKGMTITFLLKCKSFGGDFKQNRAQGYREKFSDNADKKTGERAAKRRAIDASYKDGVIKEDLKVVFEIFGMVKYIAFQKPEEPGHIQFEEAEASDKALVAAAANEEGGILVKNYIAILERYSGFKRIFQSLPRKDVRPPNPFMQLLQIQKYRVPPTGQLFPKISADSDMPCFGIRWCIPEAHYLVEAIPVESHLPPHEACRMKLHYMSLDAGNPKSKNPNAPKVMLFKEKTTRYLKEPLDSEYPYLRKPLTDVSFRNKRFNKHLGNQNVLDQQQATELMLSCHMTFQMADLLIDMRYRAPEFAVRERCVCYSPSSHPGKRQMQADDLCTLIRDLMGPQFEPKIHVKDVNNNLILHEITHFVNESMEVLKCIGKQYNGASSDLIIF